MNDLPTILNRRGRNREAEKLLREVVRLQPGWGQGHYSLGLLLAEDRSRLKQAADHLGRAARGLPQNPRVHYNLGIALWQLEERDKAAAAILTAAKLEPNNPEFTDGVVVVRAGKVHADRQCTGSTESVDVMAGEDYGGVASDLFYEGN